MLRAIFLGHQGWLLASEATRILVDPLLTRGFGHGGMAGEVFPARDINLQGLSPIDAVFLTHEHDDHFDIASLLRVDRRIPIFISARSSIAMHGFLVAQGFEVRRVEPATTQRIGDLHVRSFVADHTATPEADEWDVLPFIVSDDAGQGVFASSVDVAMPEAMLAALAEMSGWPGVLCLANNTTDTRFVQRDAGTLSRSDDTDALARVLGRRLTAVAGKVGLPRVTAITGGGWQHPRELAWVDAVAFSIDPVRLSAALSEACGGSVRAVLPGEGVELRGAVVREFVDASVQLRGRWERPARGVVEVPKSWTQAVTATTLSTAELSRLAAGLDAFARFCFGRRVFAQMHSLPGRDPLAFVLHTPTEPLVFAYRPASASFERVVESDPFHRFTSGFECWAADLLALLDGRLGASALCYSGRLRCWNGAPNRLRVSPQLLWLFSHPLHRPEVARSLYEHVAAAVQPCAETVRAR